MQLTVNGYASIARALKDLADELCDGRLIFTLEGGYHLEALAYSILNTFAVLLDDDDWQLVDPLGPSPHRERPVEGIIEQVRHTHGLDRA
jgi:acetoin utilization deacetylase AcuC-like enzyme